ncbi:MAG: hypothetical protein RMI85_05150 [Candidatus Korarchaeum sp.]|nr:hypothetical protein [Candidatus Korarchaeum sp.]
MGIRSAILVAFDTRDALRSIKKEEKLRILEEELIPKAERLEWRISWSMS